MYAYYIPRNPEGGSNYSYDQREMLECIKDTINGIDYRTQSHATNSSYGMNGPAGDVAGTFPTAGIYTSASISSNSSYAKLTFTKKHYATGQTSGYTPSMKIELIMDTVFGLRCRVTDKNGANMLPRATTDGGWHGFDTSPSSVSYDGIGPGGYGHDFNRFHVILNDTTFGIKAVSQGTTTARNSGWFMVNDLEYTPTIDNWAYGVSSTFCPSVSLWSVHMNGLDNPTPSESNTQYAHFGLYQPYYVDGAGIARVTPTVVGSFTNGSYMYYSGGSNRHESSIYPSPGFRQEGFPIAGGDGPAHQLTPVHYNGQSRASLSGNNTATSLYGNPRNGRLMNFYRTTDNLGSDGDVLLEGTTRYRLIKVNKTGNPYAHEADVDAFYAFPEDNVPYS